MHHALQKLLRDRKQLIRPDGHVLRVLTARELLAARSEAEEFCEAEETAELWRNVCVLARAVCSGEAHVFDDGEDVLRHWSAEKILTEMKAYEALAADCAPALDMQEKREEIMEALRKEPMERIRWKVLRAFSALPTEKRVRDMTEGDYLYCAVQLLLDQEERESQLCPRCREKQTACCPGCGKPIMQEQEKNPSFDTERFEELKRNG